jgi:hypothetical protein
MTDGILNLFVLEIAQSSEQGYSHANAIPPDTYANAIPPDTYANAIPPDSHANAIPPDTHIASEGVVRATNGTLIIRHG